MDTLAALGDLSDPAALGRALSRVESDADFRAEVDAAFAELTLVQRGQRIGITGAPGAGKSTLLARLVPLLAPPSRPAVLAVDPTSAHTGGAVLADRYRFAALTDSGVFIRSFASRGSFGGLSPALATAARLPERAGYGPLLIETVGSGQTGFAISALADTVVILLTPESGDGLQLLKAGLLEAGDIFCVNKSDRPGADAMLAEVRAALVDNKANSTDWQPPALALCAESGAGVEELSQHIAAHWDWLRSLPAEHPLQQSRLRASLAHLLRAELDEVAALVLHESEPELIAQLGYSELETHIVLAKLRQRAAAHLARQSQPET